MNLLKSIFISTYMMALMTVAAVVGWQLAHGGSLLGWGGVLLTAGPILVLISALMLFKNLARTSPHFPLLNLLGVIGVMLAVADWRGGAGVEAAVLAGAAWGGFLVYAYWFSTFGGRQPSASLAAGQRLPHFTVKNVQGQTVSSEQLTDRPAILLFFRGNWCPLCMAQIKELVALYKEIEALGVRVAMISPQPHGNTVALAQNFAVNFDFLTDEDNHAARILGIEHRFGTPMGMQTLGYDNDTVLPTVIVTDRDGLIVWSDETDNYRVRPEPELFLDVLRRFDVVAVG